MAKDYLKIYELKKILILLKKYDIDNIDVEEYINNMILLELGEI